MRSTRDALPTQPGRRTKPVRLTVDMPPHQHRRLKAWTAQAALDLDVTDVPAAEVIRYLVHRLTLTPQDADYDPASAQLAQRILDDLRSQRSEP